ncbi:MULTISPECIES: hypothetical protein [unclassified Actinoplanes]|uniref:hypothetical protein n=1 Tax=unclassified Actinoplanes TaxID=2626549 RepID=UPI0015610F1C
MVERGETPREAAVREFEEVRTPLLFCSSACRARALAHGPAEPDSERSDHGAALARVDHTRGDSLGAVE